jgi:hypothetical protein
MKIVRLCSCHYYLNNTVIILGITLGIISNLELIESIWKNVCRVVCKYYVDLYETFKHLLI